MSFFLFLYLSLLVREGEVKIYILLVLFCVYDFTSADPSFFWILIPSLGRLFPIPHTPIPHTPHSFFLTLLSLFRALVFLVRSSDCSSFRTHVLFCYSLAAPGSGSTPTPGGAPPTSPIDDPLLGNIDKDKKEDSADVEGGVVKANKGMILRKSVEYIRCVSIIIHLS